MSFIKPSSESPSNVTIQTLHPTEMQQVLQTQRSLASRAYRVFLNTCVNVNLIFQALALPPSPAISVPQLLHAIR